MCWATDGKEQCNYDTECSMQLEVKAAAVNKTKLHPEINTIS